MPKLTAKTFIKKLNQRRLRCEALEDRRMLAPFSVSNLNDSGTGSLRDAIAQANAAAGADTISFAANLSGGTINLTGGELVINEALTIDARPLAANITINANQLSRIINITPLRGDFLLGGLTLTGGKTTAVGSAGYGGAIRSYGREDLVLSECRVVDNTVTGLNAGGGGIFSRSLLKLADSIIENNSTTGNHSVGGGIYAVVGTVSLERSIVRGNSTAGGDSTGGGIWSNDNVGLTESTLTENKTTGSLSHGGGIFANSTVFLLRSTLSNNTASAYNSHGGGIWSAGHVTVRLSTLSGNSASAAGGGIYSTGSISLSSSTVTNNRVVAGGGHGGGIYQTIPNQFTSLYVENSILSGNISVGGHGSPSNFWSANQGSYFLEYSVIGSGNNYGSSGVRNVLTDNPGLGPLADNGGLTKTHALLPGSRAINVGNPVFTGNIPYDFDQRGDPYVRNVGSVMDAGAYEFSDIFAADFDEDGDVDGRDFLRWQRGFGTIFNATHLQGDANSDRDVTALDLIVWQNQYGMSAETSATSFQLSTMIGTAESSELLGAVAFLATSNIETISDKAAVITDEYSGQVDQAFAELGNIPRGTNPNFGEIAVRRSVPVREVISVEFASEI